MQVSFVGLFLNIFIYIYIHIGTIHVFFNLVPGVSGFS